MESVPLHRPRDAIAILPPESSQGVSSHEQETMIEFLRGIHDTAPYYNMPIVVRIRGQLSLLGLDRALNSLIHQQEVLRTVLPVRDPTGSPIVLGRHDAPISHVTVEGTAVNEMVREEIEKPFDFATPMLRVVLFRSSLEEHTLLIVTHHLVCDGISAALIVNSVVTGYKGATARANGWVLPRWRVQYRHYALWQRAWLSPARTERELAYWDQVLADVPPQTLRPTHATSRQQSGLHSVVASHSMQPDAYAAIAKTCRSTGVTMFSFLLAAVAALTFAITDRRVILLVTAVGGRRWPEIEPLVGSFAKSAVLRLEVDPRVSLYEMFRYAQATALELLAHQDLDWRYITAKLRLAPGTAGVGFFFDGGNRDRGVWLADQAEFKHARTPRPSPAMLDAAFRASQTGESLTLEVRCAAELYERSEAETLLADYVAVVETLCATPAATVGDVVRAVRGRCASRCA